MTHPPIPHAEHVPHYVEVQYRCEGSDWDGSAECWLIRHCESGERNPYMVIDRSTEKEFIKYAIGHIMQQERELAKQRVETVPYG